MRTVALTIVGVLALTGCGSDPPESKYRSCDDLGPGAAALDTSNLFCLNDEGEVTKIWIKCLNEQDRFLYGSHCKQ